MPESFVWLTPSLLWQSDGLGFQRTDFFRPTLLEYCSDDFMDEFLAAVASPAPTALAGAAVAAPAGTAPMKFFQPFHGRYYLACASLCCRLPGFPDRQVSRADGESLFFVLRKRTAAGELGWMASDPDQGWVSVGANPAQLLAREERLPMFATVAGNQRSVIFGYIPVASRDTYAAAPSESPVDFTSDIRLEELRSRFLDQLDLLSQADSAIALRLSVYLLLDLWEFFETHLPALAKALLTGDSSALTGADASLLAYLGRQHLSASLTLAGALGDAARHREALNSLADDPLPAVFAGSYSLAGSRIDTAGLEAYVKAALPAVQSPVRVPKLSPQSGDRFVVRCIYARPQCEAPQAWVSQPSQEFQLAPVFDPDAPARPIRIVLPTDLSFASLRKAQKGVAVLMSASLRNKIERISGKEKDFLTKGDMNPEGSNTLGMICSLSIPIITICALILLLVIVVVLNIVFWWMPFFRICLPLKLSR